MLAELKRIEGQQQQLKTAAAENKVLIVHPIEGVILEEEDDDYAVAPEAKADPDLFVPSGEISTGQCPLNCGLHHANNHFAVSQARHNAANV